MDLSSMSIILSKNAISLDERCTLSNVLNKGSFARTLCATDDTKDSPGVKSINDFKRGYPPPDLDSINLKSDPLFFLNFKMEGEFSKFRTDVILADRSTGRMFSDKIRQVYLELPYFPRGSWEECENDFERWIYLLKYMETLERMPERLRKSVFERLLEVADVASLTKEERVLYDEALKRYRDYKNTVEYAEEKGIKKGRQEEKRNTALNMKAEGIPSDIIQRCTGLSLEEIERL